MKRFTNLFLMLIGAVLCSIAPFGKRLSKSFEIRLDNLCTESDLHLYQPSMIDEEAEEILEQVA